MPLIKPLHIAFALALGLCGLLVNLYPIPLFGNQQLIIGNFFYVIVAIYLGPWYALASAILCSTGLFLIWETWHMYLMFPLEALWLGFARRKEIYSLYADASFWIILGMPVFFIYTTLMYPLPDGYSIFIALKQGINGLFYAAIGSILVTLTPPQFQVVQGLKNSKHKSFNSQLTYTFTQILTLVLLVSALIFNNQMINQQQLEVEHKLDEASYHLSRAIDTLLDNHIYAINNAAKWISLANSDIEEKQELLFHLHRSYPYFTAMLIADEQAHVVAASPQSSLNIVKSSDQPISVEDRHYFQAAFKKQQTFISPVFLSRGFGKNPIVAISAPIYQPDNPDKPIGIIEGSLDLSKFSQFDRSHPDIENHSIIMVDSQDMVIYASQPLNMPPLTPFKAVPTGLNYNTILSLITFNELNDADPEYVYKDHQLANGWRLYVVIPFSPLLSEVEKQYLLTFSVLLFAFIITILLIQAVGKRLTLPLEMIAQKFSQWERVNDKELKTHNSTPREIFTLANTIQQSRQKLISYQLELEEKVALRTLELKNANAKLQQLAEKDELTQLYNRRYTEKHFPTLHDMCKRSHAALAFCIVDIDHFKQINDTYGHQAGDKALKTLARLMQQFFKRETDLVSRYGGEEFLIILPQCNPEQIEHHLNQFRLLVADTDIQITDKQSIKLNICIGAVVSNTGEYGNIDHWFKMADLNLYQAKESGRNQVICTQLAQHQQA
ncbi:diguanylate cyclase [Shewanella sp. Isolate11]|uniref:diguanylate cyclase n=1 Tax=Shewanella sp. Isolate11 TaxID=2908530 RepID=UPI001EFEC947|nr:diguanylate cyclase [Shewanella sp. Isolate11]MCG9698355.1 diguanylate cyclase [Shewanella sp. Isolate11]